MSNTDIVEEIKAKLDIVTITSQYLELRKSGRNFKALCPFHKEHTPSFMISPDKQIAYCFGCQKGGDIFKFIMEVERLDFPEAIKFLADKAGIEYTPSSYEATTKGEKDILLEITQEATTFFEEQLQKSTSAQQYTSSRALTPATIAHFHIGYAPSSYDDLWKHLQQKGYTTEDILKAGLLAQNEGKTYNKFRSRLMFPITNHIGNIVGFGGRTMENIDPKYLNSPETPIYHKSHVLYGLSYAKEAIKETQCTIIVEGYMDFLSAWQAGVQHIVATSGTALTKEQLQLLKRHTQKLYFLFDNDSAGWQATLRNAEIAIPLEFSVHVISLKKEGVKDLDEFFSKYTKEDLLALQHNAPSFHDYVRDTLLEKFDRSSIEGKKRIIHLYLPLIKLLASPVEQEHYLAQLAYHLMVSESALKKEYQKMRSPKVHEHVSSTIYTKQSFLSAEGIFIGICMNYPELFKELYPQIKFQELDDDLANHIYKLMKNEYTFSGEISQVKDLLSEDIRNKLHILLLYLEEANLLQTIQIARTTALEKIALLHKKYKDKLLLQLAAYQKESNHEKWNEIYSLLSQLR